MKEYFGLIASSLVLVVFVMVVIVRNLLQSTADTVRLILEKRRYRKFYLQEVLNG